MNQSVVEPPVKPGDRIPVLIIRESNSVEEGSYRVFDFGATYPIGDIRIEKAPGNQDSQLSDLFFEYSIIGKEWAEWKREENSSSITSAAHGRYMRVSTKPGSEMLAFNWESIAFYAGRGLVAEPMEQWTELFHKKEDWSGADGIYSIPLNGVEAQGRANETQTLFLFGDTFIGAVDKATHKRLATVMVNNTFAVLKGARPDPERITFLWNKEGSEPASVLVPATAKALSHNESYYWLQDGTSIGGKFYCFPLIIGPNPNGAEGFQFSMHGVTRISAPMGQDGPLLEQQLQVDTPLCYQSSKGLTTYFGAAIMPNTEEAGAANPDGYVYIYGIQNDIQTRLVAARVPVADFEDFDQWTYWSGTTWSSQKENVAPITEETSCEVSVSQMSGGALDGKYIVAYQQGGIQGNCVSLLIGDSPVGPFNLSIPLFHCTEPEEGKGIYTYNAKGHPHLSSLGELLISYNVNTTSIEAHMNNADIYRPRFIRLRQLE